MLKYLEAYPESVQQQALALLNDGKSEAFFKAKYTQPHGLSQPQRLYDYAMEIKKRYMRSGAPISKVVFDDKLHVVKNALGLHTYAVRVQGKKLKAKNEVRVSGLFRKVPEPWLRMILVHELAHLKEKDHNKAFYNLCCHMEPDYHQLEFELRFYLNHRERFGDIWV
ncbi:MAG: YgjP-like metallopeptidase domain-containing protein [Pontibacterium sp.]